MSEELRNNISTMNEMSKNIQWYLLQAQFENNHGKKEYFIECAKNIAKQLEDLSLKSEWL